MQKGLQERTAALQTLERVLTLSFGNSPDTTLAMQKYNRMLSELTRARREGVKNSAKPRTEL
jgi:hypothetical protein